MKVKIRKTFEFDCAHSLSKRGMQFYAGPPWWLSTTCLREMVDVLNRHHPTQKDEVTDGDA